MGKEIDLLKCLYDNGYTIDDLHCIIDASLSSAIMTMILNKGSLYDLISITEASYKYIDWDYIEERIEDHFNNLKEK